MTANSSVTIIAGAAAISIAGALAIIGLPERIEPPQATAPGQAVVEVAKVETPAAPQLAPIPGALPFPVDIDVAFDLTDHFGNAVSEADFQGKPMLLFFGYASCEAICSVALPRMGEALNQLGDDGDHIAALMVTVDPDRDTPGAMRASLPRWHDRLLGLTGDYDKLADMRDRFQVNLEVVATDPVGNPIYAHGSFIYLIGADGELKTMVPPILGPERIAELARKYF
ncbi:MAG: SCO family protein [Pseudomonadota bacterium]